MAATERMNSHMSVSEFHCVATTTKITHPSHFQSQRVTPATVRSSFIAARRPTSPHLLGPVLDRRPGSPGTSRTEVQILGRALDPLIGPCRHGSAPAPYASWCSTTPAAPAVRGPRGMRLATHRRPYRHRALATPEPSAI